ncbi:PTS sugar transporter subunit IIA [Dendrosporobacter sp. 1207_IL3150]|uniref:PTS sugar transporter subunit IIA n=1 Tax=Dendrosporobacter sp. 1207_IL3150 TaxID=3084054 RepID=UPI002FD93414
MFNKISSWFSSNKSSDSAAASMDVVVYAPLDGRTISLEKVPDPAFAQKMLGDGMAIEPISTKVLAPFDGKVIGAFPTNHAIGLCSATGLECLIHVGIDTVTLNGHGFRLLVKEGQIVKQGNPLIEVDLDVLRSSGKALSTPVVITNGESWKIKQRSEEQTVSAGKEILFIAQPVD